MLKVLRLLWNYPSSGLKLAGTGPDCEENEAWRLVQLAALSFLGEKKLQADERASHAVEDLLHGYQHKLEGVKECLPEGALVEPGAERRLLREVVQVERRDDCAEGPGADRGRGTQDA